MQRSVMGLVVRCVVACGLLFLVVPCSATPVFYHDRALFTAALGGSPFFTDDYESYAFGPISLGDRRGDFLYTFDPSVTQPAVVTDFAGGKALGGSPFDVFVGGDAVTLSYQPLSPQRRTCFPSS